MSSRKGDGTLTSERKHSERKRAPSPTGVSTAEQTKLPHTRPEPTSTSALPTKVGSPGLLGASFSAKLAEGAKRQGLSLAEVGAVAAAAAKQRQHDAVGGGAGSTHAKKKRAKKKSSMTERQPTRSPSALQERLREPTERC